MSVCLADWNYDGGRFWILFFSKEDPFEYLLREGLVQGRERSLTDCAAHPILGSTSGPSPLPFGCNCLNNT